MQEETFYQSIPVASNFVDLAAADLYRPLPDSWIFGMADIVDSTTLIDSGNYKTVNTVGAAVISAHINALPNIRFPFVFAGDGAAFSVPPDCAETAARTLDAVRRWAKKEFDIELRTALLTVRDIRQAGHDVLVARYAPSKNVDYAMFSGGGMTWVDAQMKDGRFHVAELEDDNLPNLTGLSCRWTPMKSNNGSVLSIVVAPIQGAESARIDALMRDILSLIEDLKRNGHPVLEDGPGFSWPPKGLELEAKAGDLKTPLWLRKLKLYFETFVALIFFKTGWKVGGFDPAHYVKTSGQNSDFRKFEDGLMMTLDCDSTTRSALEKRLETAQHDGIIHYGMVEQSQALMTCIVPSVMSDDHLHFVDGASGGYAKAAMRVKQSSAAASQST